jgi:hypothetical protein
VLWNALQVLIHLVNAGALGREIGAEVLLEHQLIDAYGGMFHIVLFVIQPQAGHFVKFFS